MSSVKEKVNKSLLWTDLVQLNCEDNGILGIFIHGFTSESVGFVFGGQSIIQPQSISIDEAFVAFVVTYNLVVFLFL